MDQRRDVQDLINWIGASPTAFHAVESAGKTLRDARLLQEGEAWHLEAGQVYVVTRNQSSLIAFRMPEGTPQGFQVVASHTDSPMMKIKQHGELSSSQPYVQLNVEVYGGMIMSSWFDRPLSVAGRVTFREGRMQKSRLISPDRDLALIPNVAIHMNRDVNKGFEYKANVDLMPLWGDGDARGSLLRLAAREAGVPEEDITGWDLFVINRMPGSIWGGQQVFFSAPRIDNLECAYCSLLALRDARMSRHVQMIAMFDNEEVGSGTRQGADSDFLSGVMERIALCAGMDRQSYLRALASSVMLSADNAHAVHPNHPEYADPENRVYMNRGIVIKANANQRYTSDSVSAGLLRHILKDREIPFQDFYNRSDLRGGSTLGNISGRHVGLCTVDIGLAQLAMHSSYETAGCMDLAFMTEGMRAFLETDLVCTSDGEFCLEM